MIEVRYSDQFRRQFRELPEPLQEAYLVQEDRLRLNPFDSRLHAKPLKGYKGVFSFRVTRKYRVLFKFSDWNLQRIVQKRLWHIVPQIVCYKY